MIIDCFTFFDEFEILEIRLHELDEWVDRFVLVECAETYSGEKKPLYFLKNKNKVKSFLPKITHLIAPAPKNPKDFWVRIKSQTDYLINALDDCADGDLILIGDVDEIPKGLDFTEILLGERGFVVFVQRQYFFYLNLRRPGGWPGTVMMPFGRIKDDFDNSMFDARIIRRSGYAVKSGGWHFTKVGDIDSVALKLKSSGHYNLPSIKKMWSDKKNLHNVMEVSRAIKGRKLSVSPIDEHPKYFLDNIEKFKHLLTK